MKKIKFGKKVQEENSSENFIMNQNQNLSANRGILIYEQDPGMAKK
jgi:hypothetical protein